MAKDRSPNEAALRRMLQLYAEGLEPDEIAERVGHSSWLVRKALRRTLTILGMEKGRGKRWTK